MDLIALACQEVGLDLSEEILEVTEVSSNTEWRQPWQEDSSQEVWPVLREEGKVVTGQDQGIIHHKQLSFGGNFSRTVFTDDVGNSSSVSLQFLQQSSSPVTNLYSQRKTNPNVSRRSRPSQVTASIQGAPCRNLPDLPVKSDHLKQKSRPENHPTLEVPSLHIHSDPLQSSNPFYHLFEDSRPGQLAFAFYVSDCWFSYSESSILPDQEEFLVQCQRWWINLPTPYRRGYWTREVEHRNKTRIMAVGYGKGKFVVNNKEKIVNNKEKNAKKSVKNNSHVDGVVLHQKKSSPPKNLMTAFKNYRDLNKSKVAEEMMMGATGREIRTELGKRWKALNDREKERFIELPTNEVKNETHNVPINMDWEMDSSTLKCKSEVQNEDHGQSNKYEIKIEKPTNSIFIDDHDHLAIDPKIGVKSESKVEGVDSSGEDSIKMTVEEIEQFAIQSNFFIEAISPDPTTPRRKNVLDPGSNDKIGVW